jgi:hypothetical protein
VDDSSVSSDKGSREQMSTPGVLLDALTAPTESIRARLGRTGLGVFMPSAAATKESDTASLSGKSPQRGLHGTYIVELWLIKWISNLQIQMTCIALWRL